MSNNTRAARLAKRIQTIVATALEREFKDWRLQYVTVTDTRITGDLHDATIFYTVRGRTPDAQPDLKLAAEGLERVRGPLRRIVGEQLGVRYTPTLSFEYDQVPEASAHMEAVLARARARDAELAKLKEHAQPAGDPNPYKTSEEDASDELQAW